VLIARLTGQLRCYLPEPVDETWGRLRHLGARREQLIAEAVAQIQQIRALLECVWPASLDTARQPFRSQTWVAAVTVVAVSGWPGSNAPCAARSAGGAAEAVAAHPACTVHRPRRSGRGDAHRRGALERVQLLLADWRDTQRKLADTEQRMTGVLDELELTELVTSIPAPSVAEADVRGE
jgi:hypothetical protein